MKNAFRGCVALILAIASVAAANCAAAEPQVSDEITTDEAGIHFATNVSPIGNLFYQIECLGNRIRCSQQAYEDLWQQLGPLTEGDQAAISEFSDVLDVYGFRAQLGPRSNGAEISYDRFGIEVVDIGPPPTQSFSLLNRVRLAAYGSASPYELFERLDLFMHPDDAAALRRAVVALWPRFKLWWDANASERLLEFDDALADLLEQQNRVTLPSIATLFGLQSGANELSLTIHLVAHPLEVSSTKAEVVENQAIVEVLASEAPSARIGVIVHELVHYLFAIAPKPIHDIRLEGALRSEDPRAASALGLTNEALAAAIGNGFVEENIRGIEFSEYLEREGSFYARHEVDVAAKAIYSLVREYLENQKTIDDQFADQYYARVSGALGAELDSLPSRLRVSAYIATDEPLAQAMRGVPRLLGMNSLYGSTLERGEAVIDSVLHRHSYLNGVVLLREIQRSIAGELLPEASSSVESLQIGNARSCIFTRPSGSSVYFVIVDESEPTEQLLVDYMQTASPCQ